MSAKDAPGEVKDKNRQNFASSPNFDASPNISSAADEEQQAIAAEEAAKKQSETILIDGIPIDAKEIKYKASDIKKKGKTEYFVNVEGAEQRKKEAIKKAREEAMAAEKQAKEKDERVIGELKKKASVRKKENRKAARNSRKEKSRKFLHRHKRSLVFIVIVIIVIAIGAIYANSYFTKRYADIRMEEASDEAYSMVDEGEKRLKDDTSDTPEDNLIEFYESQVNESKDQYDKQQRLLKYAQAIAQQVRRYDLSNEVLDRLVDEFPDYANNCDVLYLYQSNYIWMGDMSSAVQYDEKINNKCIDAMDNEGEGL